MPRTLDVYFNRQHCGQFVQGDGGQTKFKYSKAWFDDASSMPLSQSLPLREQAFSQKECRGFFGGILPEQVQRIVIAANLGISKANDFAMLERIGGECAGAVSFMSAGVELPSEEHSFRALSEHELAEIIRELPRRPLMAGEEGIRLSLAGAQSKLAVHVVGKEISIPLGGAPSTHILKPAIEHFHGIVHNEAVCMNLAKAIGLNVAPVQVQRVENLDYLLVQRYDRVRTRSEDGSEIIRRLHQEDFCQALGVVSDMKYQNEGGPSFKQGFELLRGSSSVPVVDLQALLNAAIFNFLIGNHDAHGKNFSLLYTMTQDRPQTRLAPLYDLISTAYYPDLSQKMAMKIGGEYDSDKVFPRHFEKLAEETGLSKALTVRRVIEVAAAILELLPEFETEPVSVEVAKSIRDQCERTLRRFAVRPSAQSK